MTEADGSNTHATEEILKEVEARRRVPKPLGKRERRIVLIADRIIYWLANHWLMLLDLGAVLYVGLPVLAPVFMVLG
ncbi:MAG: hypothetical protein MUQ10_14670, partial [Anaerolineae bacterium]|nr:hypothetical protein [Anaerolineae bacterium]